MKLGSSRYFSGMPPEPFSPAYLTDSSETALSAENRNHTTKLSSGTVNAAWERGPWYSSE